LSLYKYCCSVRIFFGKVDFAFWYEHFIFSPDLKKNFDVPEEQKYDIVPEFWQGHNIADFIDPDIFKKLEELEKEEEMREKAGVYDSDESEEDEGMEEIRDLASKIRIKKKLLKNEQRTNNTKKPVMARTTAPKKRGRSVSRCRCR
jgi:nucleolar GTP-binding protein